ncbi:hypothetical protein F5141DRAFT_1061720 [Pisolithus sp. B1]|nr:hypothetical protein F5141DRAFT_1061720 [Pisolithus sp. B1]
MSHVKLSSDLPVKIGPPISVRRSKRIKGNATSPTKVQPGRNAKSCHQMIKGMMVEECEQQYLDSFCTKMVTLNNGQQLHPHVALQQLCAGLISKDEIVEDGDCDEGENACDVSVVPIHSMDESTVPNTDMDSETEERVVEDVMQPIQCKGSTVESSDEHSDWSGDKRCSVQLEQAKRDIHSGNYDANYHSSTPPLKCSSSEDEGADTDNDNRPEESSVNLKCGRLPMGAICQVQALGMHTTQEAQAIANKYGKTLISIMTAAGLTSKATWAESVWNLHQAWYAHANPKASREHMKDYYSHQAKHYKDHKDEEEYPQLWVEIHMFWSESISGMKDTSSKAMGLLHTGGVGSGYSLVGNWVMVQMWCNVEGIHVFSCVIYSGSDEAAHQAQGIFAGSPLCMQLAYYLATIVKYKVLNSAASVPLPNFMALSQVSYDQALALKPQESRHDHNHCVLPVVFMHKLYKVNLVSGQKNVPWKTLLDVLYTAQYTIMDWPAHVPAVGPDFNIRCLNADELHALVVPFLKEQMGVDYHAKTPGEEEDQDGPMIVPSSSFHLKKWTPEQSRLFRLTDSQMFSIPLIVNMSDEPLHILSDSQAFLRALLRGLLPPRNQLSSSLPPSSPPEELPQPAQSNPSSPSPTDESPQLPVRRHVHVLTMCRILVVIPLLLAPSIIHANIIGTINSGRNHHSVLTMCHILVAIPLPHAPGIIHANIIGTINSVRVITMHPHHREGTIIASKN